MRSQGFHGDIAVPLSAVREVSVEPDPWSALRGIRAPGTGFPGVIAYGVRRMTGGRPDFAAILGFARVHDLARLSFWSVNRDRPCAGGKKEADSCSGIAQQAYEFTDLLAQYHG